MAHVVLAVVVIIRGIVFNVAWSLLECKQPAARGCVSRTALFLRPTMSVFIVAEGKKNPSIDNKKFLCDSE